MIVPRSLRLLAAAATLGVVAAGCSMSPPPAVNRLPVGDLTATRTPAGIEIDATASDPDSPTTPVAVGVTVNGIRRLSAVADGVADGRSDRVDATVTDLSEVITPIVTVCLDVTDNETGQVVPVACVLTTGTRIITNGAIGSIVDRASGAYWVRGIAIDPNSADPVPMRLRSVAGPTEIASVSFVADGDTSGTVDPIVLAIRGTLHAYGPLHGFEAAGVLDTTGADAVLLEARATDGTWELVADY